MTQMKNKLAKPKSTKKRAKNQENPGTRLELGDLDLDFFSLTTSETATTALLDRREG